MFYRGGQRTSQFFSGRPSQVDQQRSSLMVVDQKQVQDFSYQQECASKIVEVRVFLLYFCMGKFLFLCVCRHCILWIQRTKICIRRDVFGFEENNDRFVQASLRCKWFDEKMNQFGL